MSSPWLPVLLSLVACAPDGTLVVDGPEGYSEVNSAVWLVQRGETTTSHHLLLASGAGACAAWQDAASMLAELEVGPRDDCEAFQAAIDDVGSALDEIVGTDATTLKLDLDGAPAEGTWATPDPDGEDMGPTFTGRLRRYTSNPYTWASTGYDCLDPDPLSWYVEGLFDDYAVTSTTLELSSVGSGSIRGSLSGRVADDHDGDGIDLGTVEASARWSRCEIEDFDDPVLGSD